ncbi:acetyl-coa biotin carboxyl carrier [Trichococcus palustris]|uniref:Biotin carboxyl carrier protein of acetyl-CoA carboxylase n=1 Tax=Trichococcus palustris TaxID=140314 RepID=A0A143YFP5_9LACT|nr:acetyl-CoA carboxylase biotin carboxyl carrier protein [Trichococcus palustris]CZQ87278.1 acetyl-coa biotin carboxyl carrier [Trichococcus palustris]SFK79360.1 acetyl-CoA carboxylase biotin carboxyl carrier protein [Trichococcus palustris]
MNIEDVKSLIALIDESTLTELHYETADFHLLLSKNKAVQKNSQSTANAVAFDNEVKPVSEVMKESSVEKKEAAADTVVAQKEGHIVTSPIVGVVYLAATPESKPYVTIGQSVSRGDVVCLVEAMKLMNEIKSEFSGEIVEILVENEQIVEYNQPLFRII